MNTKKNLYRLALLAALMCLTVIIPGCWDKDEPDEVVLVMMVAFDVDEEGELIKVAAQVANPLGAAEAEEEGGADKGPTWTEVARGHSTYEAVQNLELKSTRQMEWAHLEVLIVSEAMAKRGLRPILDYFDREHEARLITRPLVVGGDVMQLMEMEFPLETIGGQGVSKHLLHTQEERSVDTAVDSMRLMFQKLSNPGEDLALPLGEIAVDEETEEEEGEEGGGNQITGTLEFTGGAVFRGDKLAGFMDHREGGGMMWITGEVARATLLVKCPGCKEASITLEVFQAETELEPEIVAGKPRFELQVKAESRIQDFACPDFPAEEEFMEAVNRRQATVIRNEIKASLERARELGADIFGLGNLLYRKKPQVWEEIEEDWREIFAEEAEVDVEVETTVGRHGQVTKPITIR